MGKQPARWAGRAILLVNLEQSGLLTARCEFKPVAGDWVVWWGWRSKNPIGAAARAGPPAVAMAAPKAAIPYQPARPRDLAFPELSFRPEPPGATEPEVARVRDLLAAAGRPTGNLGRDVEKVKKRRVGELGTLTPQGKHTDELFEAPRRHGTRPGSGRHEWVATERVLRIMHEEL